MAIRSTQLTTAVYVDATIANGASLSGAVELKGYALTALIIPAEWDTATVATFNLSVDGSTYYNLYHDVSGTLTEYSVPVAASRYIALDATKFMGVQYIKVRAGTAGAASNQTGATVVTLVCFPV